MVEAPRPAQALSVVPQHAAPEIIPPSVITVEDVAQRPGARIDVPSDGQREHAFLLHQADKFEQRALRIKVLFVAAVILSVLSKAGVPVATALLKQYGLPTATNLSLVTGLMAGIAILFAAALLRYELESRAYALQIQLNMNLGPRSLLWRVAAGFAAFENVLLVMCFVLLLYVSVSDLLYVFTYIHDHVRYVLDGWEPVVRTPHRN